MNLSDVYNVEHWNFKPSFIFFTKKEHSGNYKPKSLIFFFGRRGEWHEIIILECSANKNSGMPSLTHAHKRSKTKSAILHNCWLGVPLHTVHHWLSLSLSDQSPTPEPRVGGVCSCWHPHPTGRQPAVSALQRRPHSVLRSAASPQWVRVCSWLCVVERVITGHPQPGVEFKLTCFRATFSCKEALVLVSHPPLIEML